MTSIFCYVTYLLLLHFCIIPTALCQFGCSADINPESPVVNLEESFTAYCIINESCVPEGASKVFWKIKDKVVPETHYKVINETVSSVTFENASMLDSPLTCNYMVYGHVVISLHGIFLTLGYPPDKPTNLSCIMYNNNRITCTWNPGRPTLLSTNYTLKHRWPVTGEQPDCIPQGVNNSCTISKQAVTLFYVPNIFSVVAKNALGTAVSDDIQIYAENVVKPNAPVIRSLISTAELPNALKVEWENPMSDMPDMKFKYTIRYRTNSSNEWEEVPQTDTASHRTSFTLQSLLPYTEYVVSLRCRQSNDKGYWSDWSMEARAVTPEAKPREGPELWRQISNADSEGKRLVTLKWKKLDSRISNGEISMYTVSVKKRSRKLFDPVNVTETSYEFILPAETFNATVIAHNSAGASPPSSLVIPATKNYKVLPPEIDVYASPKDGRLWVEWTPLTIPLDGYVIEWCVRSEKNPCDMQWQREPSSAKGSFLRGYLEAFKCYLIKVYPLYGDDKERPRAVEAYLEQGVPIKAPSVRATNMEKNKVLLKWNPVSVDDQQGFILNYSLTYKPISGNASNVTINRNLTEFTLTSLTGDTLYSIYMTAYTEKGGTDGVVSTFRTAKFANGEVEAIVVSSCIGFLIVMLVVVLVFFTKGELIKKLFWPNVPDPSKSDIAKWSPQTPSRHEFNTKGNLFQDGSFTDVSVVEITADDKKSYTEQDMKTMDSLKKEKNTSEGLSSGIGGSSCLSSPRLSVSDSDEVESAQNTSGTVQYSTVILSGYRDQQPTAVAPHTFSRSESTQPLLDSEERPDEQQVLEGDSQPVVANQYFKQNCQEDRLQTLPQDDLARPNQDQRSGPDQNPNGLCLENDLQNTPVGQNGGSEVQVASQVDMVNRDLKSYLPQIVRQGGYMPQ
ncbi:interleukin-6 receptor subunit beta-like [Discoglossus pictus]